MTQRVRNIPSNARWFGLAALASAWACASPAAALTISGTTIKTLPAPAASSSPVTADGASTDVIYYLDLKASPVRDERFSVHLDPGKMATLGGRAEGESIDGPLQFTLYGPGQVGEVVTDPQLDAECSRREEAFHGYATGRAQVDVWLPAGAATTFAVRYNLGRRAPWIDTDYTLRFGFEQRLTGVYEAGSPFAAGPPTSIAEAVSSGRTKELPVVAGRGAARRLGAHLLLSPRPAGTWGEQGRPRAVRAGSKLQVRGELLPALGGKRVQLQWSARGGSGLRTAATAQTDKQGRFRATVNVPRGSGVRELWAAYPGQPGPLAPDTTSCPLSYRLT